MCVPLFAVQTLHDAKTKFRVLSNETKRKRLSADVEIKVALYYRYTCLVNKVISHLFSLYSLVQIRSIYFDRIDRGAVDKLVSSIYESIPTLEDMEFLIKYMTEV